MAVRVTNRNGKKVTLLNPSEKANKFATELAYKVRLTNDGIQKTTEKGRAMKLTKEQRAYRAGYLAHQKDSNKAFRSRHPNYKRKTVN